MTKLKKAKKEKKKSKKATMVPPSQRKRRRWTADNIVRKQNPATKKKKKTRSSKRFSLGDKQLNKAINSKQSYQFAKKLLMEDSDFLEFEEPTPKNVKKLKRTRSRSMGDMFDSDEKRVHKESLYHYGRQLHRFSLPQRMPSEHTLSLQPEQKLDLFHVYGYKGECLECNNNILLSFDKKTIIYCKSSLVILLSTETNTQKFFRGHTREVSAITVWPNRDKQIAASGQHPDASLKGRSLILVWDYITLETLRRIESPNRSPISLHFSPHFKTLYTMNNDDDHSIVGYSLNKKQKRRNSEPVSLNASKQAAVGLACHSIPELQSDYLVIFGRKLLKFGELTSKDKGATFGFPRLRTVRTSNQSERGFYCAIFPGEDNKYLVGGHSGQIYKCEKSKTLTAFQVFDSPIFSLAKTKDGIIACCALGLAAIIDVKDLDFQVKRKIDLNSNPCVRDPVGVRSLCYNDKTGDLYCGLKTSQITRINLEGSDEMHIVRDAHCGIINAVAAHPTCDLVLTGGSDGSIKVWDYRNQQCLSDQTYSDPHVVITTLVFCSQAKFLVAGTDKSNVLFFKTNPLRLSGTTKFTLKSEGRGVSAMSLTPDGSILAVGFLSGDIRICTVQIQGEKIHGFEWGGKRNNRVSSSAVLDLQWSFRVEYLRVFTKDYSFERYSVHIADRFIEKNTDKIKADEQWFGRPLRAGWDVRGLYQPGFDGSYLQCVAKSRNGVLIAAGDRKGVIRLHNYPALIQEAHFDYVCHSNCVNDVTFSRGDDYVFTVASDGALFQWEIDGEMVENTVEVDWEEDTRSHVLLPSISGTLMGPLMAEESSATSEPPDDYPVLASVPSFPRLVPIFLPDRDPASSHISYGQLQKQAGIEDMENFTLETWKLFITDIEAQRHEVQNEFLEKMESLKSEATLKMAAMFDDSMESPYDFTKQVSSHSNISLSRTVESQHSEPREFVEEFNAGDTVEGRVDGVWLTGVLIAALDGVYLFKANSEQHLLKRKDLRWHMQDFVCGEKCHGYVDDMWKPGHIKLERNGVYLFKSDSGDEALLISKELKMSIDKLQKMPNSLFCQTSYLWHLPDHSFPLKITSRCCWIWALNISFFLVKNWGRNMKVTFRSHSIPI